MGRKKFDSFSKEKKQSVSDEINVKINEITRLKKSYEENLDIFDAVNDEMKTLLECDADCSTCDKNDIGRCMQNFRLANVFLQRQCRQLIDIINHYINSFATVLEGASLIIAGLKAEEVEEKIKQKEREIDYYR